MRLSFDLWICGVPASEELMGRFRSASSVRDALRVLVAACAEESGGNISNSDTDLILTLSLDRAGDGGAN